MAMIPMKKIINAQRKDKKIVIDILIQSFLTDPQINWMIGSEGNKGLRLKRLMAYTFEQGMLNGKIQLTEDKKAVAVWRNHHSKKMSWFLLVENIKFLLSFGYKRVERIIKMEKQIAEKYPKYTHFEYLWSIGTSPTEQGKGYGSALLASTIESCEQVQKEILLETTTKENLSYYRKRGFNLYDTLRIGEKNSILVYLLKMSNS